MRRDRVRPESWEREVRSLYSTHAELGTYVVEEESPDPAEGRTVDGASGTAQERPRVLAEVRNRGVRVVKEGDHH